MSDILTIPAFVVTDGVTRNAHVRSSGLNPLSPEYTGGRARVYAKGKTVSGFVTKTGPTAFVFTALPTGKHAGLVN